MVEDGLTDWWRQGVTGGNHKSASASLNGMNLAEHVSLPPSFSFLLSLWQVFIEHTLFWGHSSEQDKSPPSWSWRWVFIWLCSTGGLICGNMYVDSPPQCSTWTSWEQEPLLLPTQVRLSVFPSLLLDFFCVIKQWLCWTLEARDWVRPWGDSFHPLISYVFNFVSLPLETQSLSMWPLSKSVVFVLAEVRIWRAILLMD